MRASWEEGRDSSLDPSSSSRRCGFWAMLRKTTSFQLLACSFIEFGLG